MREILFRAKNPELIKKKIKNPNKVKRDLIKTRNILM